MKIKITPFTNRCEHMKGEFRVGSNFYYAKYHSAGSVSEVKDDDTWLDEEMAWVSRSEIPFVTALRHSQAKMHFTGPPLIVAAIPVVRRFTTFFKVADVDNFPADKECAQMIMEQCDVAVDGPYHFYTADVSTDEINKLFRAFDYKNDLFVRAGSCIHKAYILLSTSHTFAEEIYLNSFIALESIIEHLKLKSGLKGPSGRKKIVEQIGGLEGLDNFRDYEEEMRDSKRNNIIHPFREYTEELVAQPFMMADDVFEDLALVDWIFKQLLLGKL